MRPFSFYLNESFVKQIEYYVIPNYGQAEYNALVKAKPISLLDGLMELSITTQHKPTNTNPSSLKQTPTGWVSIYRKNT